MRDYILEKVKNTPRFFMSGGIEVYEKDPLSLDIDLRSFLSSIEDIFPEHFFKGLKGIIIGDNSDFKERSVNAMYKDGVFYITNKQENLKDLMDDIIHEFAHHVEMLFPEDLYSDEKLKKEFLNKRKQLEFELRSEGYWTQEYDFSNLKFSEKFDIFLYKRIGKNMLRLVTSSIFIRPYAAVSLREYWATGFEAYFMGQKEQLQKISPDLYDKINDIVSAPF